MNTIFRVDASVELGIGHVMRCLTLADLLRKRGAQVFFVCVDLEGNANLLIEQKGYPVLSIPVQTKWDWEVDASHTAQVISDLGISIHTIIVDHYRLDYRWEEKLSLYTKQLIVIDDLANRKHTCDILLDQNYHFNMYTRYDSLVGKEAQLFLGPTYALLRSEFFEAKKISRKRTGYIKHIMVFFSGSDPTNETMKTLEGLKNVDLSHIHVHVIVGKSNPLQNQIRHVCANMNQVYFYCQIENMAEMMTKADLAIGAGGVTMWERCYLGLPSITIMIAENQKETTKAVAEYGAIWNLGWHQDVKPQDIADILNKAIRSPEELMKMSECAQRLMNQNNGNSLDSLVDRIVKH